nr:uncharacterized protein LOC127339353 [Lolium perenne]
MNAILLAPYEADDVKKALFQMFPLKAPGPDGYPAFFFQKHWDICGPDVTRAVLSIVQGNESAEIINDTILVIIPKLDMMKAYDRVEWEYLEAIMLKLGFSQQWTSVIMGMVNSVSFSVLFNGNKLEEFKPTRGIRQGDPISPYLFLLAAEGLSCLLKSNVQSSHLEGIKVAPLAPPVNHLLFADDSLLFFKGSREGTEALSGLLEVYCQASGQRINRDKSSIFFTKGCPQAVREVVKNVLLVANESLNERYLGMPTDVGSSINGTFKFLRERVWNKIKGWIEKILSAGGKEVLVKSIAQAIPVFSMACFRLPRGLCDHINSLIRQFWWGSKQGKRKVHWVSWEVMTRPKHLGGLGFRDIELFNLSLLARQSWRILQEPNSLSARLLKAIYFPNSSILEAELGPHPSKIWRSILDGREVLAQGLIRRIGDGRTTKIWEHNWLPRDTNMRPIVSLKQNPPILVSHLIDETSSTWREEIIREFFLPIDAAVIMSIPLCTRRQEDFWAWNFDRRGIFSVRSTYRMMISTKINRENYYEGNPGSSNAEADSKAWCSLWKVQVPSKVRVFLWRLARQSLPTADLLEHRNMAQSSRCSLCGGADSWRHSLIECNMSASVWALSDDEMVEHMRAVGEPSAKNWLFKMIETLSHVQFTRLTVSLWAIWTARRKAIHEEIFQSPLSTHGFINSYLEELKTLAPPRTSDSGQSPNVRQARWMPPPSPVPKINVDAAVAKTEGRGVAAAFCRDSNGDYLGSSVVVFVGITDPARSGSSAAREALALAEDLSLTHTYIVSDCQAVVTDIRDGSMGKYGSVISEIRHRSNNFSSCTFAHENRASNFEAHNLARHMINSGIGRHLWLDTPYSDSIPLLDRCYSTSSTKRSSTTGRLAEESWILERDSVEDLEVTRILRFPTPRAAEPPTAIARRPRPPPPSPAAPPASPAPAIARRPAGLARRRPLASPALNLNSVSLPAVARRPRLARRRPPSSQGSTLLLCPVRLSGCPPPVMSAPVIAYDHYCI